MKIRLIRVASPPHFLAAKPQIFEGRTQLINRRNEALCRVDAMRSESRCDPFRSGAPKFNSLFAFRPDFFLQVLAVRCESLNIIRPMVVAGSISGDRGVQFGTNRFALGAQSRQ
jgi:hypothetical protein